MMWRWMKSTPSRAPSSWSFRQHSHSSVAQPWYQGWATLEWECCLKDQEDGAREGVDFIHRHIIRVTSRIFDDFAGATVNKAQIDSMLGIA